MSLRADQFWKELGTSVAVRKGERNANQTAVGKRKTT